MLNSEKLKSIFFSHPSTFLVCSGVTHEEFTELSKNASVKAHARPLEPVALKLFQCCFYTCFIIGVSFHTASVVSLHFHG